MSESGGPLGVVLAPAAQSDIRDALMWRQERFGERAAMPYRNLLRQAIHDVAADQQRPGSQARPDLARSSLGTAGKPRHFLGYRRREGVVEVVRVLHDARALERHLPPAES
jgi:plasmid stabilization system protein ParE